MIISVGGPGAHKISDYHLCGGQTDAWWLPGVDAGRPAPSELGLWPGHTCASKSSCRLDEATGLWFCQPEEEKSNHTSLSVLYAQRAKQCGGKGGACGALTRRPCVDAPWPGHQCSDGLSCIPRDADWWECADAREEQPTGGPHTHSHPVEGSHGQPRPHTHVHSHVWEVPEHLQCGGLGGICGERGGGNCVDAPWEGFRCADPVARPSGGEVEVASGGESDELLGCTRENKYRWACMAAPVLPEEPLGFMEQCGGTGGACGRPGLPSCEDRQWRGFQCGPGLSCGRESGASWVCHSAATAPPPIRQPDTSSLGKVLAAVAAAAARQHAPRASSSPTAAAADGSPVRPSDAGPDGSYDEDDVAGGGVREAGAGGRNPLPPRGPRLVGSAPGAVRASLTEARLCWAVSYWRGFGLTPNICDASHPSYGGNGRCYDVCPTGFEGREGGLCWMKKCPHGWHAEGSTCVMPSLTYDKGCCRAMLFGQCTACCSGCPPGYEDMPCQCRRSAEVFGRSCCWDAGVPARCPQSRQNLDGGQCYVPCRPGHEGLGDRCWLQSPSRAMKEQGFTRRCGLLAFARTGPRAPAAAADPDGGYQYDSSDTMGPARGPDPEADAACSWLMERWAHVTAGVGTSTAACLTGYLVTSGPEGLARAAAEGTVCGVAAVGLAHAIQELVDLSNAVPPCQHD
ncbi:hypothetical protein HYH03_009996 [Edaphochlamys debaryana]|uniref:Uncharacterized protein n=1 Tax=Edaphochlamys debaryana TaxID=47281 RepID=A0A835XXD5_9CHLO|nr:hypothetical protein HYH03_009996 [Edaphochlamys debaryana]|eukprot:KAG2491625.1 hypothetical protein HYH03_009996 [Edaphochlamys debaryana]